LHTSQDLDPFSSESIFSLLTQSSFDVEQARHLRMYLAYDGLRCGQEDSDQEWEEAVDMEQCHQPCDCVDEIIALSAVGVV
jgi:hypothetical protein